MDDIKYSIMVIDDHPIIHDGLSTLLAAEKDMEIVSHASSASEAMTRLRKTKPDIAIIDLSLGDSDGTYLIQRIHSKYPKLKILVYTMSEEKLFAERTASAGADGYVMKTTSPMTLRKAIRTLLSGGLFFAPDIQRRVEKKRNGRGVAATSPIDNLSNREMDVFKLIGEGFNAAAISDKLQIRRNTVDTHRINIKNKLGMANGKALERYAYDVIQKKKIP